MTAEEATLRLAELFRSATRLAAAMAMAVGVLVLLGWIFRIPFLMQVIPGHVAMVPNTAVGFFLTSVSL